MSVPALPARMEVDATTESMDTPASAGVVILEPTVRQVCVAYLALQ